MNIAIVGGGIGGITAALLLSKKGHAVTIYEKENKLGGRLTYQTDGTHKIDQGPTIVLLPEMLKGILSEAGVDTRLFELVSIDPLYDLHYPDGTTFRKHRDIKKQSEEISRVFPGNEQGFFQYINEMEKIFNFGTGAFLSRSFMNKRDFLSLNNLHFVLKSKSYRTVDDYLQRYFKEQRLRDAYSLQTLYIGGAPHQVPALYGLISYSEHAHGVWYLKGGYHSLIPKLEQVLNAYGVSVKKNTAVDEIVVKDNRVKGVLTGSDMIEYDKVIYNGDYPTIEGLVKGKKVLEKTYNPSSGCIMVYLGLDKRYENKLVHQFFMSNDFNHYMETVIHHHDLPEDPSIYLFDPSQIDPEAQPEGKSTLYLLIPVPTDLEVTDEEIEAFVKKQINRVEEQAYSQLSQHIEWVSIRTPRDAEKDGLYLGGSFGVAPLLGQSGAFRPQIMHPSIKGLYAVGASVHPGGGVPIVMQGARLLASAIEKGE